MGQEPEELLLNFLVLKKKDKDGNKIDKTTTAAQITNSTSVMMTTIAENKAAVGYISLGSLNDTVKSCEKLMGPNQVWIL